MFHCLPELLSFCKYNKHGVTFVASHFMSKYLLFYTTSPKYPNTNISIPCVLNHIPQIHAYLLLNQACAGLSFLKIVFVWEVGMCACVSVCLCMCVLAFVSASELLITGGVIWTHMIMIG